jgi:CHAT domain-containing protein
LDIPAIASLELSASTVVLSACRTALGAPQAGEGLIGLTRAFFLAGARRVVATLWEVQDRATAEMMQRFYAGMFGKKLSPAAALRQAQQALRASERWRHPYYWAGVTVNGDWR